MSITTYEFLSILQAQNHEQPKVETNSADYAYILLQTSLAQNLLKGVSENA